MHNQLKGIYAPYINQFIDFKKSVGFKYDTEKTILIGFDRFTIERGEQTLGITKELAESWQQCKPNESSSYKIHRCTCLNQFASYLCKVGISSHMLQLPRNKSAFTPHIFSREQMAAIFSACDALCVKKKEWILPLLSFLHLRDCSMQQVYE